MINLNDYLDRINEQQRRYIRVYNKNTNSKKKKMGCISKYFLRRNLHTYVSESTNYIKYLSEFVVMEHDAKKAGHHFDLRFKLPNSNMWASFAIPKGFPKECSKKYLIIKTKDHTKKEAFLTGKIEEGYGAGTLKIFDKGKCTILKWHESTHIILDFEGIKIKGVYHILKPDTLKKKDQYFICKAENPNKWRELSKDN